jgi:hypothetical protein
MLGVLSDERTGLSFTIAAGFASAVILVFYCLRFETLPTWRARSPYLYRLGTGGPVMAAGGLRCIASARTAHKTSLPTFIPLLRVTQPLHSNGCYSGTTVLTLSKNATIL